MPKKKPPVETFTCKTYDAGHISMWKNIPKPIAVGMTPILMNPSKQILYMNVGASELKMLHKALTIPQISQDLLLKTVGELEDDEGLLTERGMQVAHAYAHAWVGGDRDYELEKRYPALAGLFYDLRVDDALAREHALD